MNRFKYTAKQIYNNEVSALILKFIHIFIQVRPLNQIKELEYSRLAL